MELDLIFIESCFKEVVAKIPLTLLLTFLPLAAGLIIGFFMAKSKMKSRPFINGVISVYNSMFRSIPLVVLLFLAYYGIPKLCNVIFYGGYRNVSAKDMNSTVIALIVLVLYSSSFLCEILYGAIRSVDPGQWDAAESLGMNSVQTYARIILPQAMTIALPNIGNFCIALLKGTSVVFTIAVVDMMAAAKLEAENGYRYIEAYIIVGFFYVCLSLIIAALVKESEKKLLHSRE